MKRAIESEMGTIRMTLLLFLAFATFIAMVLSYIITRSITRPLNEAVGVDGASPTVISRASWK